MLVVLITLEVKPSEDSSLDPWLNSPRNALVTKKMENVLILYRSPQASKVSLSKRAWPRDAASFRSGAEGSPKNVETGPTCPALCER